MRLAAKMAFKLVDGGFLVFEVGGVILSISDSVSGLRPFVRREDVVISNGNFAQPFGTPGIVKKIFRPYATGRTSNVIQVRWLVDGSTSWMKLEDLLLPQAQRALTALSN